MIAFPRAFKVCDLYLETLMKPKAEYSSFSSMLIFVYIEIEIIIYEIDRI